MGLRDRAAQAIVNEATAKAAAEERHHLHCWKRNAREAERLVRKHLSLNGKTKDTYSMTPEEKMEYRKQRDSRTVGWGDESRVEVVEEDITLMVKVYVRTGYDEQKNPTAMETTFWITVIDGKSVGKPYKVASLADVGRAIERHDQQQGT